MFRRILLVLFVFSLFVPLRTNAVLMAPFFNVTVNKTTIGADGSFNFHIKGYSGVLPVFSQDNAINTLNGVGTFTAHSYVGSNYKYYITEDVPAGWTLVSATCVSDQVGVTFQAIPNGVLATAQPYSNVTCDFVNAKQTDKTPILIVPGVLGTDLYKGELKLWANISKMLTDVGDDFMDSLAFNSHLDPIDDSITLGEVVKNPSGVFNYTQGLIDEIKNQGYTEGGGGDATLFTFPYDWRYGVSGKDSNDVVVNEEALRQKIQDIIIQTGSSKVDVVAHSTGGLLVKKYVMDTPEHHIGKAVFVGVPNTGAPKAIKVLLTGDNFGIPWLADAEMKKIGQNLPVLYDLAPSQTYVARKGSFLKTIDQKFLAKDVVKDLNYTDAWLLMTSERGANSTALSAAESLHLSSFDDFDLRTAGVDIYNIVGCKAGTVGQMVERRTPSLFGGPTISYDAPVEVPGDGTVPLESATNVPVDANHKYYALKTEHGKMMSQDGPRQQIVNILAGTNLSTPHVTQDIGECKLNGKAHAIFSPLDVEVIDQAGNRLGKREDGSLQNDIPNADFSIYGEHKFLYLPDDEGQTYQFRYKGTGNGTFTYKLQDIQDNAVMETEVFSDIPVTTNLVGSLSISNTQTELILDTNGDGTPDQTVLPTSTLNAEQSKDVTSPETTPMVTGTFGQPGYYRSNVSVALSASDQVEAGVSEAMSGLLNTFYKVDGDMSYMTYASPISISTEGKHTIYFYSTDKAGNTEATKTLEFTVDKSAPETEIQFNPSLRDLQFTGTEPDIVVQDNDSTILLTDLAGNVTKLVLKETNRRSRRKAEVASLWYNNALQDLGKTGARFYWEYTSQNQLKLLDQYAKANNGYNVDAYYQLRTNQTVFTGREQLGRINKTFQGLKLLKIITNKADFTWSY